MPIPFPDFPPFHKVPLVLLCVADGLFFANTLLASLPTARASTVVDRPEKKAILKRRMDSRLRGRAPLVLD